MVHKIFNFFRRQTKTNFIQDKKYEALLNPRYLNDGHGVMLRYKLTTKDVVNLCGGIPSQTIEEIDISIESIGEHVLSVKIDTTIHNTKRRINFQDKYISNDLLALHKNKLRKKNFGAFCLINQIKAARKWGFQTLDTYAEGGRNIYPPDKWNGHYTWARLGYEMAELSTPDFKQLMLEMGRNETNLRQLMSIQEGRDFWLRNGHSWSGTFHLSKKKNCMRDLKSYLEGKEILVKFFSI